MMQLPFYSSLDEVREAASVCRACSRSEHRAHVVFGHGNADASLMLVAEYPSATDNQTGLPYSGPAGHYLDDLLQQAGTSRDEIYITNIVRCYAAQAGTSGIQLKGASAGERKACSIWMNLELQFVDPTVILAIGSAAAAALIGGGFSLSQQRGSWHKRSDGRWISATMQPAYVLRVRPHDAVRADQIHKMVLNDIRAAVERSRSTPPE